MDVDDLCSFYFFHFFSSNNMPIALLLNEACDKTMSDMFLSVPVQAATECLVMKQS